MQVSALRERYIAIHMHALLNDEERSRRITGDVPVAASGSRMGCWVGEQWEGGQEGGDICFYFASLSCLKFHHEEVFSCDTNQALLCPFKQRDCS